MRPPTHFSVDKSRLPSLIRRVAVFAALALVVYLIVSTLIANWGVLRYLLNRDVLYPLGLFGIEDWMLAAFGLLTVAAALGLIWLGLRCIRAILAKKP